MRARTFWGIALIVFGGLLLLERLGVLPGSAWSYVWPLALIGFGLIVLIGAVRKGVLPVTNAALPLGGAHSARVVIKHGAGQLRVDAGEASDMLLAGAFTGGVESQRNDHGEETDIELKMPSQAFAPWDWFNLREGLAWDVQLNPTIPLKLSVDTGASSSHLNLTKLNVQRLDIHTGASSVEVTMPAHAGRTTARVESGVASVDIRVPDGVAARISGNVGMGELKVDQSRFPRHNGTYETPNFDTATDRIELDVQGGVGAVSVR